MQKKIPVNQGDEVTVTIEAVGEKGDGIARISGFVVFVANANKGDVVKVKITKVLAKVSFGEVIEKVGKKEIKDKSVVPPPKKEVLEGDPSEEF